MPKIDASERRERKWNRARYGMRVTGRSVFVIMRVIARRGIAVPMGRPIDRSNMVEPGNQADNTKGVCS